jgi:hypothetical protein
MVNNVIQHKPKQIWVTSLRHRKNANRSLKLYFSLPNFVDCDVLIVDLSKLNPLFILGKIPKIRVLFDGIKIKTIEKLSEETQNIAEMIKLGGTLICIMAPYLEYSTFYTNDVDNYSWLPIHPVLEHLTPGEEIDLEENVYMKKYYTKFVKKYYFQVTKYSSEFIEEANVIEESIVRTKAGRILGFSIKYGEGYLHFLPPPTEISHSKAIDFIVKNIREKENELLNIPIPPYWMQNYVSEIENKTIEQRNGFTNKINELDEKIRIYQEINRMVWVCGDLNNGKTLENAIKTLVETELKLIVTKTSPGSHVDLKAINRELNRKFAFEVTGVSNKVVSSTKKCVQITHYNWEKEKEEKIVFIANTYCDRDIKDRPKENFSKEVIETLKPLHVCLVTTVHLFGLWKEMKRGNITREEILNKMYETDGVLE